MYVDLVIWDDDNEPHIVGSGQVTIEEVEEVFTSIPEAMTIRTTTAPPPGCR